METQDGGSAVDSMVRRLRQVSAQINARILPFALKVWAFLVLVTLLVADWLIWLMLRTRSDERTIRPTKRVASWPKGTKRELMRRQGNFCAYCGHRRIARSFEIDHMTPVIRGGSNELDNLQVICRPCNQRKGIQTDGEFRERYARMVPSSPLTPPRKPISQTEFKEETRRTPQPDAVQQFRKKRFITPREKVVTGSMICGGLTFFVILVCLALGGAGGSLLFLPSIFLGVIVGLGLWLRAHITGVMITEDG